MIKSDLGTVEMVGSKIRLMAELTAIISGLINKDVIEVKDLFYICNLALNEDVAKPTDVEKKKEDNYADELHDRLGKVLAELFESLSDEDEEED